MSILHPTYKKALLDDMLLNISSNSSYYYAFAANPRLGNTEFLEVTPADYDFQFSSNWNLLFGKKIANTDIKPVIRLVEWTSNTIYTRYDNTSNTYFENDFYVMTVPTVQGGNYVVYKCIDNANGGHSTARPDQEQLATFTKSDGYTWKYMYSISAGDFFRFATADYIPVTANIAVITDADQYMGLDNIVISNTGVGYDSYTSGVVRAVVNSTLIQIEASASVDNNFYVRNGIYVYNESSTTSQLKVVGQYTSNLSGNWVKFTEAANTNNITAGLTEYIISPRVIFDTDGDEQPQAYSVVNASANNISGIVIIDRGNGMTRASATIVSNNVYGSGASVYCIVPPPGGHGSDPVSELNMQAMSINFSFANSEGSTIPIDCSYSRVGLLKGPFALNANAEKGSIYTGNTFSQVLEANVTTLPEAFVVGSTVVGNTSGARGTVVFSNTTYVKMVGDKDFANGEILVSADDAMNYGTMNINTRGDIFAKDLRPLYVNSINTVERDASQTEAFKIIIEV